MKKKRKKKSLKQVFVVHGHDEAMKEHVARVLEQLGLKPVILHEQANLGRTIIEKFEAHARVDFAVVLMSGDDVGCLASVPAPQRSKALRPRARQNVVFEMGYFIGRITGKRVVTLLRESRGFEKPSDQDGVVYIGYDAAGGWQMKLVKELKAAGFRVDANALTESK